MFFRTLLLLVATSFTFFSVADLSATPVGSPVSADLLAFLPEGVCPEEVVSFLPVETSTSSTIFRLETVDGNITYQVIATVAMEYLPTVIEWACIAAIKNPSVCKYVKYAGQALIAVYGNAVVERAQSFWSTKVRGDKGFAHIYSDNYAGAQDAQKAFDASREKANFPWSAPVTERFRSMDYGRTRGKGQ